LRPLREMKKTNSEKVRSENIRNPFKFGTVVDDPYFTNRKSELTEIRSLLNSRNHLIMSSPRRYGKTSLVLKAVSTLKRPVLYCDLQLITTEIDLAEQLLRKIYRLYPFEKIKKILKTFRIIPTIAINPLTNDVNVQFNPAGKNSDSLEDVLNLFQQISDNHKSLIVIFDEFQEIRKIKAGLERTMRAILQHHDRVNYIFLGSQESMIRDIFENNRSPFYHFGKRMRLSKISIDEFRAFLENHFRSILKKSEAIAKEILDLTQAHPYYTQQLAFYVWERSILNNDVDVTVQQAIDQIMVVHDLDYDRIWGSLNRTDMQLLIGLACSDKPPLSEEFARLFKTGSTSTTYSAIARLISKGYIVQTDKGYGIEDPFFKQWIINRRNN